MTQRNSKDDHEPETPRITGLKEFTPKRQRLVEAKYAIGQVVRHRLYPFRGVIFDVDPEFCNSQQWWENIPEAMRPRKDQPFYHLYAENEETEYIAYVSEQNLLLDESGVPLRHPSVADLFEPGAEGYLAMRKSGHLN
jgi:heat shock protein HspQ